jgi:hypothetical protein
MSTASRIPAQRKPRRRASVAALQRACACGSHTVAGATCEECCKHGADASADDLLAIELMTLGAEGPGGSAVDEVLGTPGEPLDPATRATMRTWLGSGQGGAQAAPAAAAGHDELELGEPDDVLEVAAGAAAERPAGAAPSPTVGARDPFADVRVHTGPLAADAAREVGSRAFTVGRHVVFGEGEYQPGTVTGHRLLAHELAHVVQQSAAGATDAGIIQRQGAVQPPPTATVPATVGPPPGPPANPDVTPATVDEDQAQDPGPKAPRAPTPDAPTAGEKQPGSGGSAAAGAPKIGPPAPPPKAGAPTDPHKVGDLPTGNIAVIDHELAEHQRWGAASAMVGTAGSMDRAAFVTAALFTGSSVTKSALQGAGQAALTGVGTKAAEKVVAAGAKRAVAAGVARAAAKAAGTGGAKVAGAAATRLGASAAKFTPLPGVGAVIGGVMSAYELAARDWGATGESIGKFGSGASIYEQLANTIDAVSTIIDVATQTANVVAGVIGGIALAMWLITAATGGIAAPLAGTLSTLAVNIGLGTMALDTINGAVLKQLVLLFRALHAYHSEADPRDVQKQSAGLQQAAGAATGFIGGSIGGKLGGKLAAAGMTVASSKLTPPKPGHPSPPAASGEGPHVKGTPPGEAPAPAAGAAASAAPHEAPAPAAGAAASAAPHEGPAPAGGAAVSATPHESPAPSSGAADAATPTAGAAASPKSPISADAPAAAAATPAPKPAAATPAAAGPLTPTAPASATPDAAATPAKAPTKAKAPKAAEADVPAKAPKGPKAAKALKGPEAGAEPKAAKASDEPKAADAPKAPKAKKATAAVPAKGVKKAKPAAPAKAAKKPPGSKPPRPKRVRPSKRKIPTKSRIVRAGMEQYFEKFAMGPGIKPGRRSAFDRRAATMQRKHLERMARAGYRPVELKPDQMNRGHFEPIPGAKASPKRRAAAEAAFKKQLDLLHEGPVRPPAPKPGDPPPVKKPKWRDSRLEAQREAWKEFWAQHPDKTPWEVDDLNLDAAFTPTPGGPPVKPIRPHRTLPLKKSAFADDPVAAPAPRKTTSKKAPSKKGAPAPGTPTAATPAPTAPAAGAPAAAAPPAPTPAAGTPAPGTPKKGSPKKQRPMARSGAIKRHRLQGKRGKTLISEHITPGAQWRLLMRIPGMRSLYSKSQYMADFTLAWKTLLADYKTHKVKPADNARTKMLKARAAKGERLSPTEDLVIPGIDGAIRAAQAVRRLQRLAAANAKKGSGGTSGSSGAAPSPAGPGTKPGPTGAAAAKPSDPAAVAVHPPVVATPADAHAPGSKAATPDSDLQAAMPAPDADAAMPTPGSKAAAPDSDTDGPMPALDADAAAPTPDTDAAAPALDSDGTVGPGAVGAPPHVDQPGPAGAAPPVPAPPAVDEPGAAAPAPLIDDAPSPKMSAVTAGLAASPAPDQPTTLAGSRLPVSLASTMGVGPRPPGPDPADEPAMASEPDATEMQPATEAADAGTETDFQPDAGVDPAEPDPGGLDAASAVDAGVTDTEPEPESAPQSDGSPESAATDATQAVDTEPVAAAEPDDVAAPATDDGLASPPSDAQPASASPDEPAPAAEQEEPFWRVSKNLEAISHLDEAGMTAGEKDVMAATSRYLPGSTTVGKLAVQGHRDFVAGYDKEPVVEHVNPAYAPPPGSPQEVIDIQNQMLATIDERAHAENVAKAANAQVKHHQANEKPLESLQTGTGEALSATKAHQEMVARRAKANEEKKANEGKVGTALGEYPQQAGKLTTLTTAMRGFQRFTGLAYSLPDSPSILARAKGSLLRTSAGCKKFVTKLEEIDGAVKEQETAQGPREEGIAADARTIATVETESKTSNNTLQDTKTAAENVATDNTAKREEADKLKADATRTGASLGARAEGEKLQSQSLAAALDAWAQGHRQARLDALAVTKKRMEGQGYKDVEVVEL